MAQLYANNISATLNGAINNSVTTIAVHDGSILPSPTGGDFFLLTLIGFDENMQENAWEIIKVTARSGNTLTVVRAQEGTPAASWSSGTPIELRVTAGTMEDLHLDIPEFTDSVSRSYSWRAVTNSAGASGSYYKIATVTTPSSVRGMIHLTGASGYGDGSPATAAGCVIYITAGNEAGSDHLNVQAFTDSTSILPITEAYLVDFGDGEAYTEIWVKLGSFSGLHASFFGNIGLNLQPFSDTIGTPSDGYIAPLLHRLSKDSDNKVWPAGDLSFTGQISSITQQSTRTVSGASSANEQDKMVTMNNGSANTYTITNSAHPTNAKINIVQWGVGKTTIALDSGTLHHDSDYLPNISNRYAVVTAWKQASGVWLLFGSLEVA